jgi:hypothetical protein
VRVTDPHGGSATARAPVRVDSLRPVISALTVRGAGIRYRLSEPARVTILLQRRVKKRWRTVRVMRQNGRAGRNRLAPRRAARSAKRGKRVRYRAEARALDAVGNRSLRVRRRVSAAAAKRLRRPARRAQARS